MNCSQDKIDLKTIVHLFQKNNSNFQSSLFLNILLKGRVHVFFFLKEVWVGHHIRLNPLANSLKKAENYWYMLIHRNLGYKSDTSKVKKKRVYCLAELTVSHIEQWNSFTDLKLENIFFCTIFFKKYHDCVFSIQKFIGVTCIYCIFVHWYLKVLHPLLPGSNNFNHFLIIFILPPMTILLFFHFTGFI